MNQLTLADVYRSRLTAHFGNYLGYEVVYSLAELDPHFGAPLDLVPYADTQGAFPSDGFARIVIPGDNHQGRYISNLDSIQIDSVPEPSTFILIGSIFALVILGDRLRRARYLTSAEGCSSLFDRIDGTTAQSDFS
jgi:hypothetical protein